MISQENISIFDKLYEITEGNIIIGGSTSLYLQGIIDRKLSDIDFNLSKEDWIKYGDKIQRKFKVYPGLHITNQDSTLNIDILTCLTKDTNIEFHLFINHIFYPYVSMTFNDKNVKLLSADIILKDKKWIMEDEPELTKHLNDIEKIKTFLDGK